MQNWEEVKKVLSQKKQTVILSHRSPDGDSIGSSLAMGGFLIKQNHAVKVITPDPAPRFLSWMPAFDGIINYEQNKEAVDLAIASAELIICLDFNTLSRLGAELQHEIESNQKAYIINIDHHQDPDHFAHFQLSDTAASSTAQLVYDFIEGLGALQLLNKEIGDCIYTGILTDTGSFRFSSTTARTHLIVAELMRLGVLPHEIQSNVYDNYSADRLRLLGFALKERLNIYNEYHAAIIFLSEKDLNQFNFQKGDTEGLVNYPLSVGNIKMSVLITEKDGKVKMSFRSKGDFKVNKIAAEHFNGGGHFNAAGGISDLSVLETVKKIEKLLPQYKELLDA